MKNNITSITLKKEPPKVIFNFKDGTIATFIGNIKDGSADIEYTGNQNHCAFKFIFLQTRNIDNTHSTFWIHIMDLVDNYKTLVYEG